VEPSKSVQILSYADDIDIIGRTEKAMKEAFVNLEKAARKMHLQINQGKTKYMPVTKQICTDGPTYLKIGPYKFETKFYIPGIRGQLQKLYQCQHPKCILSVNRCFHGLKNI
jgi:hypothetical protein